MHTISRFHWGLLGIYLLGLLWLTYIPNSTNPTLYHNLSHYITYFLFTLLCGLIGIFAPQSRYSLLGIMTGGLTGLILFFHTLGLSYLDPRQIGWILQPNQDWQFNFLAWQFFRAEAWQFPLGKIATYFYPVGSSIGYADTVPLMALFFKLFNPWLPYEFQYLGLWLCLCFMLQGIFGALLLRRITDSLVLQTLGASLFVLSPILLTRIGHITLCSQWLLLAGLYLYSFPAQHYSARAWFWRWGLLALLSAMIHPYLTAMVCGLVVAFYGRIMGIERQQSLKQGIFYFCLIIALVFVAWWQIGLFLIPSTQSVATQTSLGYYSMNLLAPLDSMGFALSFPTIPKATGGQYEGINYFGLGGIFLSVWAIYALFRYPPQKKTVLFYLPLLLLCVGFTLLALSNKGTFADKVLWDWNSQYFSLLNVFQSSGRFFWTVNYFILFSALVLYIHRFQEKSAIFGLLLILILQAIDLSPLHYANIAHQQDSKAFVWDNPLKNPLWEKAAPHYHHLVMMGSPNICGMSVGEATPYAYLAAKYGLTFNSGRAARVNIVQVQTICEQTLQQIQQGQIADDSIYVLHPNYAQQLESQAKIPLLCGDIDGARACVTQKSATLWQ
ncbi:hypothetical protein BegalDRAFT_1601 [Beggiatoa alba B18LD]|uniref:Uncharacterized protein n=1 Tax=Beggiatoa alba B18LD TaxID=395493 RepID=I3CFT7_9GAMM|nr:DUF6311 domain-containing protein [Beggiatoa alba]EIJ42480.1 hypothetical protein BegalDRAFT_1601 [Beggiatoa alba B18LD]